MPEAFGIPDGPHPTTADMFDVEQMCAEWAETRSMLSQYDKEALKLYEPQENQRAIHTCRAKIQLITGGNQCLAGWQELYDPVVRMSRRVDSIQGDFHVWSRNPHTGKLFIAKASKPFVKAYGQLHKFTLSTGEVIYATREHRVVDASGSWVSIGRAYDESTSLAHQQVSFESRDTQGCGEQSPLRSQFSRPFQQETLSHTSAPTRPLAGILSLLTTATGAKSEGGYCVSADMFAVRKKSNQDEKLYLQAEVRQLQSAVALQLHRDEVGFYQDLLEYVEFHPLSILGTAQSLSPSSATHSTQTIPSSQVDCPACRRSCDELPRGAVAGDQESAPLRVGVRERGQISSPLDGLGSERARTRACPEFFHPSSEDVFLRECRETGEECPVFSSPSEPVLGCDQGADQSVLWTSPCPNTDGAALQDSIEFALAHPPHFQLDCSSETIVTSMEDAGQGDVWDLTVEGYANYLCAGLTNANSGKTLTTCIEDARCVTNQDPHNKYPKGGLLVLLGFGWKHIGNIFYPKLFKPGAFKIIQDKKTRKWRAFRPWLDEDMEREDQAEDAPPLISPRFYDPKDVAWEYRGQDQIAKVRLKTGWEIWCFSSEADPDGMQGFAADRVHVDEDVNKERFIDEALARLIMRKGIFCWSAMPHSKNAVRSNMSEEAQLEKERVLEMVSRGEEPPKPHYVEFVLPFTENAFIDKDTKAQKLKEWELMGEDVLRMRAYGHYTFNDQAMYPTFHLKFHGYKRERLPNRDIPLDWTRFAAIDPGSETCAVIFAAIPPDNSMCLVYDELNLKRCDAFQFGEAMATKCKGYQFEAFIIDAHGARIRDMGGGKKVWDQYEEQLATRGVKCNLSGSSFTPGVDNKEARAEAVRLALRAREDGTPFVRFLTEDNGTPTTPFLAKYLPRFRKKRDPRTEVVLDEPETRGEHVHHSQTFEYLLAFPGLKYVYPRLVQSVSNKDWEAIKKQHDQFLNGRRKLESQQTVHFGPASSFHRSYA